MPSIQDSIPNSPFFYPDGFYILGPLGPLIVGGGLFIDYDSGTISAGGSGGPVVSSILPGSGIFVSANVGGNVTVTNTGVLSLNAGPGIGITPGIGGSFTITNTLPATSAAGTVTSVTAGPGLQGGTITTSGTIQLAPSGVSPGVYSNPTITVDTYGRITLASPGGSFGAGILATAPLAVTSTFPQTVSIAASSTSQAGAVQLNDTVTSTSTSQAATPRAVKVAYDLASTAATDATNALTSALNASTAASSAQILATTANTNAAAALSCAITADSNATTALTTANAAQTTANAAAAAVNNKIPCSVITGKGALIAGTAAGTPAALSVGTDGQVLRACAACASGLAWAAVSSGTVTNVATGTGLTGGPITSSGTIALTNTGVSPGNYTLANITVDAQGRITSATSGTPPTSGTVTNVATGTGLTGGPITSTGTISLANTAVTPGTYTFGTFTVDAQGRITAASSNTPSTGTVTSVATGTGLSGGPITSSGTIALANTAVTPGSYTLASITVDQQGRITAASSGTPPAGGTVTSVATGTGLTGGPITNTGTIALANTAVTAGSYTYGSFTVDAQGRLTAASSGTTPVTSVTAGTGLSGGVITTTGTIALANTLVTPGSYTNASLTVDAQGRLTAASSGTAPVTAVTGTAPISVTAGVTPVVSITASSTTAAGAVQLYNNTDSTSTTLALTAAQGKVLQDQIDALSLTSNLTLAGTLNAVTGNLVTVTTAGTAAGFTVGSPLPAAAVGNAEYFVIVTVPAASYTPPGGSAVLVHVGDWFLSDGTVWEFLDVGFDAPYATTSVAGIVCLSTNALAQTGTDTLTAITPAIGAATYVFNSDYTAKGDILSATAANTPVALPVGTNGQILVACSTASTGLCWANNVGASAIPCSVLSSKGSIISATAASTPVALSAGTDGQILTACAACATGLTWSSASSPAIPCATLVAKGSLVAASAASTPVNLSVGTDGQILTACAACTSGLTWTSASAPAIPCATLTAKGSLVAASAASTPVGLPVGTDGQTLVACAACTSGLTWVTPPTPPVAATPTVAGIVLGCTTATNANLGCNAGIGLTTGSNNTFIGQNAGCAVTTGVFNVAVGQGALGGYQATPTAITANTVTAIGHGALRSATGTGGNGSVAIGVNAGCVLTTGVSNVFIGCGAGLTVTTGNQNVAIGFCASPLSNTGSCQLAIGFSATDNWLTGTSTKAIKPGAGIIDCANSCGTAGQVLASNGANAVCWANLPTAATPTVAGIVLGCTVGNGCSTAVGCNALVGQTTGTVNVGVGHNAGAAVTTGIGNTAIGSCSGVGVTTGFFNTTLGTNAGCSFTTAGSNTALGAYAGSAATGGCNIFIGVQSGCVANSGVCNVVIGTYANVLLPAGSCQLTIGYDFNQYWLTGTSTKAIKPGAGIIDCVNSCGVVGQYLWTTGANAILWASSSPSDIRDKEVVGPVPTALPVIQQIEPIAYHWKDRETDVAQEETIYGFSAQQLQEVDYVLVDDTDPDHLRIHERKIVPLLVKAIQELSAKVEDLEAKLSAQG